MLLLTLLSVFFLWLIFRELFPGKDRLGKFDGFTLFYIAILTSLAFVCASVPYQYWKLETLLAKTAAEFAEVDEVDVHCNSLFESVFYENYSFGSFTMAGLAFIEQKKIILQYPWCRHLMNYLDDPYDADADEQFSLPLFTHEVMHIRGERSEPKTECQAIQRNYDVAIALGVPDLLAENNALEYYRNTYPTHAYFNRDCAKGKPWDEQLDDSIW